MAMRREQVAAALRYLQDKADLRGRLQRATSLDPQEQDLADIAVETGASLVPGVGPALAARDFERARRADDPAGMAMASMGAIPGGRLAGLLKRYDPVMQQLDVYHGTPHKFPATEANPLGEFDASKIGTGEGMQAYGHGIYLSESPEVGRQYQQFLAARKNDLSDPGNMAASIMYRNPKGTREAGIAQIDRVFKAMKDYPKSYPDMEEQRAVLQKARDLLESGAELPQQGGSFYKADLPDEMIGRMLDWDKSIKDQPEAVRKAIDRIESEFSMRKQPYKNQEATGFWYGALADTVGGQQNASKLLKEYGVPGIYHRGQGGADVRTFVVFPGEEKKVRILERK
jgi:hypothetical protein